MFTKPGLLARSPQPAGCSRSLAITIAVASLHAAIGYWGVAREDLCFIKADLAVPTSC